MCFAEVFPRVFEIPDIVTMPHDSQWISFVKSDGNFGSMFHQHTAVSEQQTANAHELSSEYTQGCSLYAEC